MEEEQRLQRVVGRHMQPTTSSMYGGDSRYQSVTTYDLDSLDDDIYSDVEVMYDLTG